MVVRAHDAARAASGGLVRILEGDRDRVLQCERTRNGRCSRCGLAVREHMPNGKCPDGGGTFGWAYTDADARSLARRLERVVGDFAEQSAGGRRMRAKLTDEQRTMLDAVAELALSGGEPSPTALVMRLAWPSSRVEKVGRELAELGLVQMPKGKES